MRFHLQAVFLYGIYLKRNLFGNIVAQLGNRHADLFHRVAVADGHAAVGLDTMEQVRMPISELKDYIAKKVAF